VILEVDTIYTTRTSLSVILEFDIILQ